MTNYAVENGFDEKLRKQKKNKIKQKTYSNQRKVP